MTVQNVGDFETGLEDFGAEDAVIPRLAIVQKEALFKDSLSGETFPKIDAIILGLVKQRILWHSVMDDNGDGPMCKSPNHKQGVPTVSDDQPKDKRFPWGQSGFRPEDYPPDAETGLILLPCDGCALKEWGSHPDGKRPYCTEQFTLPILYTVSDGTLNKDWDQYLPAILTIQKTGIKPLRSYLTSFARSKGAAFQVVTTIGLDAQSRGQTDYAVPTFRKIGETDDDNWREYGTNYRQMRTFLEEMPVPSDEDDAQPAPSANVNQGPPATKDEPVAPAEPDDTVDAEVVEDPPAEPPAEEPKAAAPATPPADDDGDDLPF